MLTATISGLITDPSLAAPARVVVQLYPSAADMTVTYVGGVIAGPVTVAIASDGTASVTLPTTGQAGFDPVGWQWVLSRRDPTGHVQTFAFDLVADMTWDEVFEVSDVVYTPSLVAQAQAAAAAAAASAEQLAVAAGASAPGYNVLHGDSALTKAIADGNPHPLSERFATLAAAQAVFPRATALTEQIDRHALQYALDHYALVVAPCDQGDYMLDKQIFTSSVDTARGLGNQAFLMPGGPYALRPMTAANPAIAGGGVSAWVASGNMRGATADFSNGTSAEFPQCPNLTLDVRFNGARDDFPGAAGVTGLYTIHCPNLRLDAEVWDCSGPGIRLYGVNDDYTRGVRLGRVNVFGCKTNPGTAAVAVSLRHRDVVYSDVQVHDNDGDGIFVDHSEGHTVSVMSWSNGGTGIALHNFTRNELDGLWAQGNGGHGILVSGATYSEGTGWVSTGNGQSAGGVAGSGFADVYFDASAGSYGISKTSRFSDIECGYYQNAPGDTALVNSTDYALAVADGVTLDVEIIGVKVVGHALVTDVRTPAIRGELTVQATPPGVTLSKFYAGGTEQRAVKLADQTVNNSAVLVNDADLTCHLGPNQTWLIDYTLIVVGADVNADIKLGLSRPAGATSTLLVVQGGANTDTGGVGQESFAAAVNAATLAIATFASSNPVVLRAVVSTGATEGDVVLQWAQNVATVSDLKLAAGSVLVARRIS